MSPDTARSIILSERDKHFDPVVVDGFLWRRLEIAPKKLELFLLDITHTSELCESKAR
jgi:response regulator RpfG family c-di-GMP phosphodiesterase